MFSGKMQGQCALLFDCYPYKSSVVMHYAFDGIGQYGLGSAPSSMHPTAGVEDSNAERALVAVSAQRTDLIGHDTCANL